MKLHDHIYRIVCALVASSLIGLADLAAAQDWIGQFPFAPPMASPIVRGRFYFEAGVRYRNIHKLEFTQQAYQAQVGNLGDPQFGPDVAGDFGTGTANLPGFPGGVNPWPYDNGSINATGSYDWQTSCTDTAGTHTCTNAAQNWTAAAVQLGRFAKTGSGADPTSCCYTTPLPQNVGVFVIDDPVSQVNDINSISGTTRVTWQAMITNSAMWTFSNGNWKAPSKSPQIWTPAFEVGFQYSNLFDLFYGFSWFGVSQNILKSFPLTGTFSQRGFQDTFSFFSDDTSAWPHAAFNSSTTIVGSNPNINYRIWPDGIGQGLYPHREFFFAASATVPNATFLESISHQTALSVYENRYGARSWFPLYGMGRMGVYLGFMLNPIYHKETGSRTVVNTADVIDPGPPPAVILPAGTIMEAQSDSYYGWWLNFGGFLGTDVELGYYRGWYFKSSVDYAICTDHSHNLLGVETRFNPGGLTVALSGGFHF